MEILFNFLKKLILKFLFLQYFRCFYLLSFVVIIMEKDEL